MEKMTAQKMEDLIAAGKGSGVGDRYQPWLKITRRRSSPCSNLSIAQIPLYTRLAHYLSRGERRYALLLIWLGAEDVREQYPLWPWPHPQPQTQLGMDGGNHHPGMSAIAKAADIPLANYPGTRIKFVLSLDLLATLPSEISRHRLIGFSCKPHEIYDGAIACDRIRERLELDRRYCDAASIPHRLVHPEKLPSLLCVQLDAIAPIESRDVVAALVRSDQYQDFVDELRVSAYRMPACRAVDLACSRIGWTSANGHRALRIAIWFQHLDVDPTISLLLTRPLRAGGVTLQRMLQRQWFGDRP